MSWPALICVRMTCFFSLREAQGHGAGLAWTSKFTQLRQVLAPPAADDMYMQCTWVARVWSAFYELLTTCLSAGNPVMSERHQYTQMDQQLEHSSVEGAHRQVKRTVLADCSNLSCFPLSCIF
ncbi:uncharacterized protein TrAtP1_011044 [Trichoderma atroviride]|uniref:uncharacterized protein n=1 Tax=Hypocrea atroviridis TaxID=63577 RepID=UPI003328E6A9|nr:hypothetical protein TrAtP1_011044 [Trichoderma atroviride]